MHQIAPRRWWASFVLAFALFTVSCAGAPTPTASPTAAPVTMTPTTASPTGTAVASATPAATPTRRPPSATPSTTVEPTATIPPDARLSVECLPIADQPPAGAALAGVVVLYDGGFDRYALLNLANGSLQELDTPTEVWRQLLVSPDGQRWAAERVQFSGPRGEAGTERSADDLVVVAADGSILATKPWGDDWRLGPAWLDAERLLVRFETGRLLELNPGTGEQHALRADFPHPYTDDPIDWDGWGPAVYDASLTRAVFLHIASPSLYDYVLWDVPNQKALYSFMTSSFPIPRWSRDGTRLAVASSLLGKQTGFELYWLDRDGGAMRPLTNFSTYYGGLAWIGDMAWSPDGHYIAFWLADLSSVEGAGRLEVVDTITQQVTDYCITGDWLSMIPTMGHDISIIWSPNSPQLVVRHQPVDQAPQTVLLDIERGFAVRISDHLQPVGWLTAP